MTRDDRCPAAATGTTPDLTRLQTSPLSTLSTSHHHPPPPFTPRQSRRFFCGFCSFYLYSLLFFFFLVDPFRAYIICTHRFPSAHPGFALLVSSCPPDDAVRYTCELTALPPFYSRLVSGLVEPLRRHGCASCVVVFNRPLAVGSPLVFSRSQCIKAHALWTSATSDDNDNDDGGQLSLPTPFPTAVFYQNTYLTRSPRWIRGGNHTRIP